jgi:hypothetical protein
MILFNPDIHSIIETSKVLSKNDKLEMIEDGEDVFFSKSKNPHTSTRIFR